MKVRLLGDDGNGGNPTIDTTMEIKKDDSWFGVFTDLPTTNDDGKEIIYYVNGISEGVIHDVEEPGKNGYYMHIDTGDQTIGYTITNKHTPDPRPNTFDVVIKWSDADDADGIRPAKVNMTLNGHRADGETVWTRSVDVEPDANGNWACSFNGIMYSDEWGNGLTYELTETGDNISDKDTETTYKCYIAEPAFGVYHVTNVHTPLTRTITGAKTWVDSDNKAQQRPDSITIHLLKEVNDDTGIYSREVDRKTVTAADNWKWTFENLRKNERGNPITYKILEDRVNTPDSGFQYMATYPDGTFNVTNSLVAMANPRPVTYDPNGGTYNGSTDEIKEVYEKNSDFYVHAAPEKEGFIFVCWREESGGQKQPEDSDNVGDKGRSFTAEWISINPNDVCIFTYDLNGGWYNENGSRNMGPVREIRYFDESVGIWNAPVREGYLITGWRSLDGIEYKLGDSCRALKDQMFTAQWGVAHTITYDLNGGTYNGDPGSIEETYLEGEWVKIHEAPTREGYVFLYWDDSMHMPGDNYQVNMDHTFTAIWGSVATVTDGEGSGIYAKGATVTITAKAAPEGKVFDKWTSEDGVTFADPNAASTTFEMPEKAVTVMATYKDKEIPKPTVVSVTSVTLNITGESVTLKKGDIMTLTAKVLPENASDKSVEWSIDDSSVATVLGGTVTANDIGKTKVTVTTKDGGFTASCGILVVDPEISEETLKEIKPDEKYEQDYTPVDEKKKEDVPLDTVPTVTIDGEKVPVPVKLTYQPAAPYTGKNIKGEQLVEKFDKTAIINGLTLTDNARITDLLNLVDIKYNAKSNKNAGKTDGAYFTANVTISKKAKKSLSTKDYKMLQKRVAAVNKELKKKANRYKFTINKRSVTDGKLIVKVKKNADESIKTKKGGKVSKVKSIKLETTDPFDATKTITIKVPAKNYKIEVVDAKTGLVRVTGLKNFTGSTTVYVK